MKLVITALFFFSLPLISQAQEECVILNADTTLIFDDQGEDTIITLDVFQAVEGSEVTTESDLQSIRLNLEHSFTPDLIIRVVCPSGQSCLLSLNDGGGSFLGAPFDDDTQPEVIGEGFDYWFESNALDGTWDDNAVAGSAIPSGTYAPVQSFSFFEGCPVNGTWRLEIADDWNEDNGYVFAFELLFNEELIADDCNFSFGCTDIEACNFNAQANQNDGSCDYECLSNDIDGDGIIDTSDLLLIIAGMGCTGLDCVADVNNDGIVSVADLLNILPYL